MQVILLLLVCSIVLAGGFLFAFIRSLRAGQFDDPVSPAHRILFDQKPQEGEKQK